MESFKSFVERTLGAVFYYSEQHKGYFFEWFIGDDKVTIYLHEYDKIISIINEGKYIPFDRAIGVVFTRLCSEFCEIAKEHPNEYPKDIPECVEILNCIETLKKYTKDGNI